MDSRVEGPMQTDALWHKRNRMGFERRLSFQHFWDYAIPPERFFATNPEYYALIGGKRVPTQLATTNPDVVKLMTRQALQYLRAVPQADSFPIDPNDNLHFDQSPEALAQDPPGVLFRGLPSLTDRLVRFANAVARETAKEFPDKLVGFYAYLNHLLPPVRVKPHPNVAVGMTRDGFCLLRLMPREDVPSTLEYWRVLEQWLTLCRHVYAYEYDPISWTGGLPCPIYLERAHALKKQHQMGVKGCWTDTGPLHQAANYVNRYLEIRLKADASRDPEAELADMCHAFFGPAGDAMNRYYRTLAQVTRFNDPARPVIGFSVWGYEAVFPPQLVANARGALDEALSLVKNDATLARRVQMVDLAQRYLEAWLDGVRAGPAGNCDACLAAWERVDRCIQALHDADPTWIEPGDARWRMLDAKMKTLARYFPDRLGFIRSWKLLGPIPNPLRDADMADEPFPADRFAAAVNIGEPVTLTSGQTLAWREYTSPDGLLDFDAAFADVRRDETFASAYAAVVIETPAATAAQLRTGSFFPYRVWLNGHEVYHQAGIDADRPDKRVVAVTLPAGRSTLLVRSSQTALPTYAFRFGLYLRFTDAAGNPIPGLKLTPHPNDKP